MSSAITSSLKDLPLVMKRVEEVEVVERDAIRQARTVHEKDLITTTITVPSTMEMPYIEFRMYVLDYATYADISGQRLIKVKFLDGTVYLCGVRKVSINHPFGYRLGSTAITINVKADILAVLGDDTEERCASGKHYELLGRKLRYGKKEEG